MRFTGKLRVGLSRSRPVTKVAPEARIVGSDISMESRRGGWRDHSPVCVPQVIVMPDRDGAGISAMAWRRSPIQTAPFHVPVFGCLRSPAGPVWSAQYSTNSRTAAFGPAASTATSGSISRRFPQQLLITSPTTRTGIGCNNQKRRQAARRVCPSCA